MRNVKYKEYRYWLMVLFDIVNTSKIKQLVTYLTHIKMMVNVITITMNFIFIVCEVNMMSGLH